MTPFVIIGLQSALSMMIFTLLAVLYLLPVIRTMTLRQALIPLLWLNAFRYIPLILFAPGQVSTAVPFKVTSTIAYGDLLSGLIALIAVISLVFKWPGAVFFTVLFIVVGVLDSIIGVYTAISAEAYKFPLNFSWMVVTFFVPIIFVSEGLIIHQLITNKNK